MVIHGFVWKKLQNRLMSTIFKSPHASANLYSLTETTFIHLIITAPNTDSIVNCLFVRPDKFAMGEKIKQETLSTL